MPHEVASAFIIKVLFMTHRNRYDTSVTVRTPSFTTNEIPSLGFSTIFF